MAQPDSGDHRIPTPDAPENEPAESVPVRYDLGRLLKENPQLYRITHLLGADTEYLSLAFRARVAFCSGGHLDQVIAIDCVNSVDYSIRPPHPALLEGGPCIQYYEQHELLDTVSQTVPNTDGLETFNPPVKFTLLIIDQSYVIAQRFEMSILHDGVTNRIGLTPARRQQKMEDLKRALDSIDRYRLPPLHKS
jgi:hypothetical protein